MVLRSLADSVARDFLAVRLVSYGARSEYL